MPTTHETVVAGLIELHHESPELARKAVDEADRAVRSKCFRCGEPIYGGISYTLDQDAGSSCEACMHKLLEPMRVPCTWFRSGTAILSTD